MTPLDFFKKISSIPRGSGNEKGIADYIEAIAIEHGLYCVRDTENNVFVRKSASKCRQDKPTVLFTAHTDMVCEKLPSSTHNFENDSIELIEKEGFLFANGTTLGADDGAGVAAMLSLMTDEALIAPETEYLFTSGEETGMYGAFAFDYSEIKSSLAVNLDNGAECSACIGCASGKRFETKIPLERTRKCGKAVKITVGGLKGGHSGTEIANGGQSAIKLLAHLLDSIYSDYPFHIVSLFGGGKDNVIPASASATVIFYGSGDEKNAKEKASDFEKQIRKTLNKEDAKKFKVSFSKLKQLENDTACDMLTLKSTSSVISALILSPQGVLKMIPDTDMVLSSVNLGIVQTESSFLRICHLARSASKTAATLTDQALKRLSHALGGSVSTVSEYPGWEYRRGSRLQDVYTEACAEIYGHEPSFYAVHAGLECGILYEKLESLGKAPDIIAIGPNMSDIHSPKEKLETASLDRLDKTLRAILLKV
ncbi:MAG: beta-Ala-His dipeptidase [Clostridia bacterium]|nr:beta-Ala-His dipeptidase [Clostridia bacterium]